MNLYLIHGRETPGEEMNDWGFDGPVLGGVEAFHCTYLSEMRVKFESQEAYRAALNLTDWDTFDELWLEVRAADDLVTIWDHKRDHRVYFGDWGISPDGDPTPDPGGQVATYKAETTRRGRDGELIRSTFITRATSTEEAINEIFRLGHTSTGTPVRVE